MVKQFLNDNDVEYHQRSTSLYDGSSESYYGPGSNWLCIMNFKKHKF